MSVGVTSVFDIAANINNIADAISNRKGVTPSHFEKNRIKGLAETILAQIKGLPKVEVSFDQNIEYLCGKKERLINVLNLARDRGAFTCIFGCIPRSISRPSKTLESVQAVLTKVEEFILAQDKLRSHAAPTPTSTQAAGVGNISLGGPPEFDSLSRRTDTCQIDEESNMCGDVGAGKRRQQRSEADCQALTPITECDESSEPENI